MKTLRECFENFDGRLLGKIDHFFEDYEAHLRPFVGTPVNLLEIGVHGGGSVGASCSSLNVPLVKQLDSGVAIGQPRVVVAGLNIDECRKLLSSQQWRFQ